MKRETQRLQEIAGIKTRQILLREEYDSSNPRALRDLMDKHGVSEEWFMAHILDLDELTDEELLDLEFVEDRIMAHLSHEEGYDDFGNKLEGGEELEEGLGQEYLDRMEGLANIEELTNLKNAISVLASDWLEEGFEKEDILNYLETLI